MKKIASAVFSKENIYGPGEISIILVNDKVITELNSKYLNHYRPTDVIAFPSDNISLIKNEKPDMWFLGDVVVSLETADKQAISYRHSFYKELALLIIHGMLHLLGYSDKLPWERKIMRRREREILKSCEIS